MKTEFFAISKTSTIAAMAAIYMHTAETITCKKEFLPKIEKALQAEGLTFTGGSISESYRDDEEIYIHINWRQSRRSKVGYNFGYC